MCCVFVLWLGDLLGFLFIALTLLQCLSWHHLCIRKFYCMYTVHWIRGKADVSLFEQLFPIGLAAGRCGLASSFVQPRRLILSSKRRSCVWSIYTAQVPFICYIFFLHRKVHVEGMHLCFGKSPPVAWLSRQLQEMKEKLPSCQTLKLGLNSGWSVGGLIEQFRIETWLVWERKNARSEPFPWPRPWVPCAPRLVCKLLWSIHTLWDAMAWCDRGVQTLLAIVGAFGAFSLMTIAIGTDYWLYSRAYICNTTNATTDETQIQTKKVKGDLTHSGLWRICCIEGKNQA